MSMRLARLKSKLHPLIQYSQQPPHDQKIAAAPRDGAIIALDQSEVAKMREVLKRDTRLRQMVKDWSQIALVDKAKLPAPIATFAEVESSNPFAIQARMELSKMRFLTLGAITSGNPEMVSRTRAVVNQWVRVYQPLGDVMSDANLDPLIEAYASLQSTFDLSDRKKVDEWLHTIADRQISELLNRQVTNDLVYAKHLKTVALIGFTTGNANLQTYVLKNLPSHVTASIESDGSTTTYRATHSVRRHTEHLQAILRISVLLSRAQLQAQDVLPKLGSPLAKAMDFAYPYLIGRMEHIEFANAKQMIEPEHRLNPQSAIEYLDTAIYFRQNLVTDVARLVQLADSSAWDPTSLYYSSMARKTDDFEIRMITPTNFRAPTSVDKRHAARKKSLKLK